MDCFLAGRSPLSSPSLTVLNPNQSLSSRLEPLSSHERINAGKQCDRGQKDVLESSACAGGPLVRRPVVVGEHGTVFADEEKGGAAWIEGRGEFLVALIYALQAQITVSIPSFSSKERHQFVRNARGKNADN